MKLQKWIAALFGMLFAGLMVFTVILAISSREASPVLLGSAEEAQARTETLAEALCAGDYSTVCNCLAGQPELVPGDMKNVLSQVLWDAYGESLSYEFSGGCYVSGNRLSRDVAFTHLNIPAVVESMHECAQSLLIQRTMENESSADEDREDFVMGVLAEAAKQVLEEDNHLIRRELTLHLTFRDGQWWIQPDNALMDILTGGMGGK